MVLRCRRFALWWCLNFYFIICTLRIEPSPLIHTFIKFVHSILKIYKQERYALPYLPGWLSVISDDNFSFMCSKPYAQLFDVKKSDKLNNWSNRFLSTFGFLLRWSGKRYIFEKSTLRWNVIPNLFSFCQKDTAPNTRTVATWGYTEAYPEKTSF